MGGVFVANEFDASLVINTAEATRGIAALDKQSAALARTLAAVDTVTRRMDGNLSRVARSITQIVAAQRVATQSAQGEARAQLDLARAEAATATARDRNASAAMREARAAQIAATAATRSADGFQNLSGGVGSFARSTRSATDSNLELQDSLSNTRYLLYDIGATYRALSIGLLAIPTATAAVAAAYERDFAQVLRTTGGINPDTIRLRSDLKALATEIPLAFGELSNIASIGGQLNVPIDQMAEFTDVVAKFVATTDVSLDEATVAFGRLRDAFPDESDGNPQYFRQIGSAITELGDRSVATESEIIAIVNQLAPLGSLAGFSSAEIAGLSSALASVRIRPELARGSFQRIFFDMSEAADKGGKSLDTFAKYAGVTAAEAKNMIQNDPGPFFTQFIGGIKGAIDSGASFNSVLEDIGLKGVRDRQFLLALANGFETLDASMKLADSSFENASYLDESSEPVFQTLIAQLRMMVSAFQNLADTLGSGALGPLTNIVEILNLVATQTSKLAEAAPAFKVFLTSAISLSAIVGVMLAIKAALAFGLAAVVGFQQVAGRAAIGASLSFRGLAAQVVVAMMMSQRFTAEAAAQTVRSFGVMGAASMTLRGRMERGVGGFAGMATGARTAGSALLSLAGGPIGVLIGALGVLGFHLIATKAEAEAAGKEIAEAFQASEVAGKGAIVRALTSNNASVLDGTLFNAGKNSREIAESMGLDFKEIVDAVAGGEKAVEKYGEKVKAATEENFASGNSAKFLYDQMMALAKETKSAAGDLEAADEISGKLGEETMPGLETGLDGATTAFDDMKKAVDSLFGSIFNIVNSEAALQAALVKMGESLAKSGSFSAGDEGGRDNLANFQAVLEARAELYLQMIAQGKLTAEQAATDFEGFTAGLMDQLVAKGADVAPIQGMVDTLNSEFKYAIASSDPAVLPIKAQADTAAAQTELDGIKAKYGTIDSAVLVEDHGVPEVASRVDYLTSFIAGQTSEPFVATVDADTSAANANAQATAFYMTDIFGLPYVAYVDADANPAMQALQAFGQWARTMLTHLGNAVIKVRNLLTPGKKNDLGLVALPDFSPAPQRQIISRAPLQVAAPPQRQAAAAPQIPGGGSPTIPGVAPEQFDNLNNGYQKAADEAGKAGKAGKKAGDDTADGLKKAAKAAREAADAHKNAGKAVKEYASNLGAALKAAYDQKYGVQEATDAYHAQLNSMKQARQDEIDKVKDLTAKIKELKNARGEDLITARKAQIEADISTKYGEFDRAADYSQQAQTARDAAAEKQRNIDTAIKEQTSIQAGIGLLTGYSAAAIKNREDLRALESKMQDMVVAYAATGASQQQVEAYARSLSASLGAQVVQANHNINVTAAYEAAADAAAAAAENYGSAVDAVPDSQLTAADNNFDAGVGEAGLLSDAIDSIPDYAKTVHEIEKRYTGGLRELPGNKASGYQPIYEATPGGPKFFNKGGKVQAYNRGGTVAGVPPRDPRADNVRALIDGKEPAMIRSGEFIVQEQARKFYGTDFMERINRMQMPRYNSGGSVGRVSSSNSGNGVVELSAEALSFLAKLAERDIVLMTESEIIARTANEGNKVLAEKGMS